MKHRITLLLAVLLLLVGCKATALTPTDTDNPSAAASTVAAVSEPGEPSVVSSKEASVAFTDSGAPKDPSVAGKVTSMPAESYEKKPETQKDTPARSFSFTHFSPEENDLKNYWVLEYQAKEYPAVTICNTTKELQRSLTEQYGLSGKALDRCLADYSETYFQANSLLLLHCTKNNTSVRVSVDDLSVAEQKLQLAFTVTDPQSGGCVMQDVLYHVEVQGKIEGVLEADCSVTQVRNETVSLDRYTVPLS